MKKIILTISAAAFFLTGCSDAQQEENSTPNAPENAEQKKVQEAQEAVEEPKEELSTEELVLGDWAYTYEMEDGDDIEMLLTLREDGTYSQTTAGNPVEGTWEFIDDEHIVVKSETIQSEDGQKWKIEKSTADELHIDWNVEKGDAKVIEFNRQ